ncbi:lectin-like [Esox lucius]|uniref:lectin-like n=1 Tax=Esox lucius TaxID=8010 RepID=UPI0014775C6F|nr:lectin-like [Esox lucius]
MVPAGTNTDCEPPALDWRFSPDGSGKIQDVLAKGNFQNHLIFIDRPPLHTHDGRWSWSDGSKFNYKNWAKGKPENFDPARRPCIQMNYGEKHWNDATCGMKFPSQCSLRTE